MTDNFEQNSFSLKRFFLGKISRKITFSFLVLGFCMAIIGTFIFYTVSVSLITSEIEAHLETTVDSRAGHIETYINQDIERIKLITSRTQLRVDIENYLLDSNSEFEAKIIQKLKDSRSSIEEIECVCFINLSGEAVACDDLLLQGRDFSTENFFIKGKQKEGAYFFKLGEDDWRIVVSGPIKQN